MKAEVITITPALAKSLITSNTIRNRPLNDRAVTRFANDIKNGKWVLNGEAIILSDNSDIIDGQHRLKAVIKANLPIKSLVVRGAELSAFDTIDIGSKRSGSDILGIAGYSHSRLLAAVLRSLDSFKASGFQPSVPILGQSLNTDKRVNYLELIKKYPNAIESAKYIHNRSKNAAMFRPESFAALTHYLFGEKDVEARDDFFDAIYEMKSGPEFKPLLTLRRQMENTSIAKEKKLSVRSRYDYWHTAFVKFRELRKPKIKPQKREFLSFCP